VWVFLFGFLVINFVYRTFQLWGTLTTPQFLLIFFGPIAAIFICGMLGELEIGLGLFMFVSAVLFVQPIYDRYIGKKRFISMADEEIVRCELLVREHPENAAYHSALARAYARRRRYTEARAEYELVIAMLPDQSTEERRQLKQVIVAQEEYAAEQHRRGIKF